MQIDTVKQFLFYPLHESHTPTQKIASVIVNIALACLTAGVYLAIFAAVRLYDHFYQEHPQSKPLGSEESSAGGPPYKHSEVAKHNSKDDCWIVIANKVYNVSKFLDSHPGGMDIIIEYAGKDATNSFEDVGHSTDARKLLDRYFIGNLA